MREGFKSSPGGIDLRATDIAIRAYSRSIDLKTRVPHTTRSAGVPYSIEAIADIFKQPPDVVSDVVGGVASLSDLQTQLSSTSRAFYLGLSFLNMQISTVGSDIVLGTTSRNEVKRDLLKNTFGTDKMGDIEGYRDKEGIRIRLPFTRFGFLLNRQVDSGMLENRDTYAAFMMGLLMAKLSKVENRVSLHDSEGSTDLLNTVLKCFTGYFGFDLGTLGHEDNRTLSLIRVRNPGKVLRVLVNEHGVTRLPYAKYIIDFAQGYIDPVLLAKVS